MNENKKTVITLGVIIGLILVIPVAMLIQNSRGDKILDDFDKLFANKDTNLVYIGSSTCSYCDKFNPVIEKASKDYKFKYFYVDIEDLSNSQFNKLMKRFDIDSEKFGTPYITIIKEGKKVAESPGYKPEIQLLEFLQENKFLSEEIKIEKYEDYLNMINTKKYKELLETDVDTVLVYAQSYCEACIQVKPILNEIAKEKDISINYFNIDKASDSEIDDIIASLETLKVDLETFGTPTLIILKNNKIVDEVKGAVSKEEYIKFFEKNDIIK